MEDNDTLNGKIQYFKRCENKALESREFPGDIRNNILSLEKFLRDRYFFSQTNDFN